MTNIKMISALVLMSVLMVGCGWEKVPPASKGKILTGSGYQDEVLEPGRYFAWWWEDVVVIDTSTRRFDENMSVILADRMELDFQVNFRVRLDGTPSVLNTMFNDIKVDPKQGIPLSQVYRTYGQMVVRNTAREVVGQYTVDEVHSNYSRLSEEMAKALLPKIENLPIEMSDITISDITYPKIVTEAIEIAEQRRLQIEQEKAQAEIDLLKRENERALAEAEYQTRMTKARTVRDENRTISEGLSPELLEFYRIENQKIFAERSGEGTTFIPIEGLTSAGASVKMFSGQ